MERIAGLADSALNEGQANPGQTEGGRPWEPICHIKGFYDKSSALRFEYRIQHSKKPRPNCISNISIILDNIIKSGDGVLEWPVNIIWL